MIPLFLQRPFFILWISLLVSMTGTFLLLIVLSVELYLSTSSGVLAGGVFAMQWVPAIILYPMIGHLASRMAPRALLPMVEIASAGVSLAIGVAAQSASFVMALLFARGFLEATMKTSRVVALRHYIAKDHLKRASSIFNSSQFIGGGLGGWLGTLLVGRLNIVEIAAIDAATFGFTAIFYAFLPHVSWNRLQEAGGMKKSMRLGYRCITCNPMLMNHFLLLLTAAGIYQGFHTAARTIIPIDLLELGARGVTLYQVFTCVAFLGGSFFVYRFMTDPAIGRRSMLALFAATSLAMIASVHAKGVVGGVAFYFFFIFFYEATFVSIHNEIVYHSPKEFIGPIIAFTNSCLMTGMILVVIAGGMLSDAIGISGTAWFLSLAAATASLFVGTRSTANRREIGRVSQ